MCRSVEDLAILLGTSSIRVGSFVTISYLRHPIIAAQMATKEADGADEEDEAPADAMAAAEKQAGAAKGPAFVAARSNPNIAPQDAAPAQANEDEIQIDEEEF